METFLKDGSKFFLSKMEKKNTLPNFVKLAKLISMHKLCRCFDCQGFGLKSCPVCGKEGLTPEQRGER